MRVVLKIFLVAFGLIMPSVVSAAPAEKSSSGNTQVIAKVGKHEITLSDLRIELSRYGASMNDPDVARVALDAIVNRKLMIDAAKTARLDREADAIRTMAAARDQALADFYLATISQPPEPTRDEIETYLNENKALFQNRAYYSFHVLTLDTSVFEQKDLAPYFDEQPDFLVLQDYLKSNNQNVTVTTLSSPIGAFPPPIRKQLQAYSENDNIVIKGDQETQILKIKDTVEAPLTGRDARVLARRLLLQEQSQERATKAVERLKAGKSVRYFNAALAPKTE